MTTKDVCAAYGITVRPAALDSALSALRDKDAEIARLQAHVDALAGHVGHLIAAIEFGSKGVRDDAVACARSALAAVGR